MLLAFFIAQAAAAQPDISLHATLDARSVKVERRGIASARAWAEPDGGSQSRSSGTRASRHFELRIDARIADLINSSTADQPATDPPAPR